VLLCCGLYCWFDGCGCGWGVGAAAAGEAGPGAVLRREAARAGSIVDRSMGLE
jgi:hypothetical protein